MSRGRRGSAVVVVLLLILAATGLAHGTLLVARGEFAAARTRQRDVERRSGAELALVRALDAPIGLDLAEAPLWGEFWWPDTLAEPAAGALFRRITREVWWARGMTAPEQGRPTLSAGRLLWMLDPLERVVRSEGVVAIGAEAPMDLQGAVDASRYHAADEPLTPVMCAAAAEAALVVPIVPAVAGLMPGQVRPGVGILPFDSALARTPHRLDGAGTPAPSEAGSACLTDEPWNLGDPDRPWRPCGTHLAVRAAEASLTVDGGTGQGALVVDGDLTLGAGARFHGFALVTGRLLLTGASEFHGMAVAAGGLEVSADSRVSGSACWAYRALDAAARIWNTPPLLMPGVGAIGP